MHGIVEKAKKFAHEKHEGQCMRGATKLPVSVHIGEVAAFVEKFGGTNEMIAAAWLHDTVEDTNTTIEEIEKDFGTTIASYVDGLTDPQEYAPLPLHVRKPKQAERLKSKPDEIKKIKLCDQLSNSMRVLIDPPLEWDDAKQFTYIKGAKGIVEVCRGIWPDAEKEFDAMYARAEEKYKNQE